MSFFKKLREKYRDMPKGAFYLVLSAIFTALSSGALKLAAFSGRLIDWIVGGVVTIVAIFCIVFYGYYSKAER